jgi:tripartite-type tricarboxylate transporter receptor subunit TctC
MRGLDPRISIRMARLSFLVGMAGTTLAAYGGSPGHDGAWSQALGCLGEFDKIKVASGGESMNRRRRIFLHLAAGAVALPAMSRFAWDQTYPTRPVRLIVPFAPAGPTDVFARLIAQKLSQSLGQQFFIENQVGGGGNIGMSNAAHAGPDGHAIVFVSTSFIVNPSLYAKIPYDPYKDFAPVTLAAVSPNLLSVHPSIPAKTVQELIAFLKANPGKYSFASAGVGTTPHLSGELFKLSQKLDLVHVPFNGSGPAIQSALGGHTPIAFTVITPAVPQVKKESCVRLR